MSLKCEIQDLTWLWFSPFCVELACSQSLGFSKRHIFKTKCVPVSLSQTWERDGVHVDNKTPGAECLAGCPSQIWGFAVPFVFLGNKQLAWLEMICHLISWPYYAVHCHKNECPISNMWLWNHSMPEYIAGTPMTGVLNRACNSYGFILCSTNVLVCRLGCYGKVIKRVV